MEWFPDTPVLVKKACFLFSTISYLAATTRKFVKKMWAKVFGNTVLNLKKLYKQVFEWNAILNKQKGSWFFIQLINPFKK